MADRPDTAHVLQNATLTLVRVGAAWAVPRHAEVAERKVVLDRVVGIKVTQRSGDLLGRCPRRGAAIRQPEIAADAMDVGINRDHELGGCDRPQAEVHAVGRANHPSCVQDEAFARTSGTGITDQVTQAPTGRVAAKRIGKTGQALAEVSLACPMKARECLAQGAVLSQQASGARQHRREMLPSIDAVDEPPKKAAELRMARVYDGRCRLRAQCRKHASNAFSGRDGVAEREACRDETRDLLVARFIVVVNEVDGVPAASKLRIATSEQGIEAFADSVHFAEVLAILPSQLQ